MGHIVSEPDNLRSHGRAVKISYKNLRMLDIEMKRTFIAFWARLSKIVGLVNEAGFSRVPHFDNSRTADSRKISVKAPGSATSSFVSICSEMAKWPGEDLTMEEGNLCNIGQYFHFESWV